MEKFVKVPYKRYIELTNAEEQLCYLESCGVDNWDPGISFDEWLAEQEIEPVNISDLYQIIEE